MFLCESCLSRHYTNQPSLGQSYGRCESCRVSTTCSDIPSRALIPKPLDHEWELARAAGQHAEYVMSLKGGYMWSCRVCNRAGESRSRNERPKSPGPCKAPAGEKARNKIRAEAAPKAISHLDAMENLLGDDD